MNNLSVEERAYMAGFLDADGSIYVRLKPNKTYRYCYQVAPNIVFFQAMKERNGLEKMQRMAGIGYLRDRKDGVVEYTIGDVTSIRALIMSVRPYLLLKQKQADLMLKILDKKKKVKSGKDFIKLCRLIDQFQSLNYSKKRKQIATEVVKTLKKERLLTP